MWKWEVHDLQLFDGYDVSNIKELRTKIKNTSSKIKSLANLIDKALNMKYVKDLEKLEKDFLVYQKLVQ